MAPSRIRFTASGRRPLWSWAAGLLALLFAAPAYSQSVADLARQEQERKANQSSHSTHVYTNEDLAKPKILVPEDQARFQNKEKVKPAASQPPAESASKKPQREQQDAALPLGDIARRYRAIKEASRKNEPPPAPRLDLPPAQTLAYPRFVQPGFVQPAAKSAAPPAPARIARTNPEVAAKVARGEETTSGERVQIQPGDTLWKLAKQHLGRGEDWTLVARVNPEVGDPGRILAGSWLRLPDVPSQAAAPSAAAKIRSVQIERGDTLWKLTEKYFGDGAAWQCLAQANPQIKNGNLIFAGQTLAMPEGCGKAASRGIEAVSVSSVHVSAARKP